jgi:uroporphyrin-III C-methyltransferase/precorrin-2 dehydrogenase/sirohydrochlorin ferrochelatase
VSLFPAFLKLSGREVLLVGGGGVATTKLRGLLDAGAQVTVVAPSIAEELWHPGVRLVRRRFEPRDVDGCWFVVSAAPAEVNREVAEAARVRRVFVNAVDDLDSASVYLGGVVRRGAATVAISTGGRAPALAGLLREALEQLLPEDLGEWVTSAERLRARWRAEGVPIAARRPLLLRALDEIYGAREPA